MTPPDTSAISTAMVVAFGIQQGIETLDSIVSGFGLVSSDPTAVSKKKAVLKLVSLAAAGAAVAFAGVDVLNGMKDIPGWIHGLVSVLGLAGGTEGVNSVLKYANYAKENKKNDAAAKLNPAAPLVQNLRVMNSK